MKKRSHGFLRRLEEKTGHGVILSVVAEELHRVLGDQVATDRLTVRAEEITAQKANNSRHRSD